MNTTTARVPDRCHLHPESNIVQTQTRQATEFTGRKTSLIQNRCGNNCTISLGWEFHTPREEFQAGPGECQNPRILHHMSMAEYQQDYSNCMTMATFCSTMAFTMIAMASIFTLHLWGLIPIGAAATAKAALLLTVHRSLNRRKPKPENQKQA